MASSAKKLLAALLLIVLGAVLALVGFTAVPNWSYLDSESETSDTRIIQSVSREEQVVLLSLGIQGISEKSEKSTFLGTKVPGSDRASFLQYSFSAKLGVEGRDVRIVQTGDKNFLISVPEFIFIGHDDEKFKLIAENNGALSFITPKNDPVDMINSILSEDAQAKYLESNEEILREQMTLFYSSIITGIDPEVRVKYDFSQ